MVVATQHFVSTLIMSTSIIRLFQWKWDAIVAALGTNPYVYKVLFAHAFVALLYLSVGSVFAVMDLTLSPRQRVFLWLGNISSSKLHHSKRSTVLPAYCDTVWTREKCHNKQMSQ